MSQNAERLVISDQSKQDIIYNEHLARYNLAKQLVAGKTVLDVACGSGYGSQLLAQAGAVKVVGVDIDSATIQQAQQQYFADNLQYLVDSAESLEKINEQFDIIVSFETIEHLQNYQQYLLALRRVLKSDGLALISTPNKQAFDQVNNPYHLQEFTEQEFVSELKKLWPEVKLVKQYNALASIIDVNSQITHFNSQPREDALYLLAICSNQPVTVELANVVSANIQALERWSNNPAHQLIIKLYKILVALKILKR